MHLTAVAVRTVAVSAVLVTVRTVAVSAVLVTVRTVAVAVGTLLVHRALLGGATTRATAATTHGWGHRSILRRRVRGH
jgi:hypothetical protein